MKLRAIYAFIRHLVDRKILPYELLYKKIRIKPEVRLLRAILAWDITALLVALTTVRDRAMILLLLKQE